MLIKQFCEATGLPRETVRFYVKRGLLKPMIGSRPGNRYQVFDNGDVERVRLIRFAQSLGFTLRQIAELADSYEVQAACLPEKAKLLRMQLASIAARERELRDMRRYLQAKLAWVEKGAVGPEPNFFMPARMTAARS